MKRFFICLGIFAIIIIVCDFTVGFVGKALTQNTGGETQKKIYVCDTAQEDLLIFGSSRAYRHYDPDIFEANLNMTAYNCGLSADGIIAAYGFYRMAENRYAPKVIIYDVYPPTDLLEGDNHPDLGDLRYFYDKPGVDSLFWNVDRAERYKMMSQMYRYNSLFPNMIKEYFHPTNNSHKGYVFTNRELKSEPKPYERPDKYRYDSLKLHFLEKLIKDCEGKTELIFTVSPLYENTEDDILDPVRDLCAKYGLPLISHYTDSTFNFQRNYFFDRIHMNGTGATEYSKIIAHEVKEIIDKQYNSSNYDTGKSF